MRSTFQPIPVKLTPPAGLAVDNAVVQFGYVENGGPGQFYCTSRQEKCLATTAAPAAVPFLFPPMAQAGWSPELPAAVREWVYHRDPGDFATNAVLPG